MTSTHTSPAAVTVLGRDNVGTVAESDGIRYYLTDCCAASAKGCDGYIGCRSCYEPVDDALGGLPDGDLTFADGRVEFVSKPMALVEVYGDGLPYSDFLTSGYWRRGGVIRRPSAAGQ